MPSLTEKLNQAKVDAAIINPMKGRFQPPRGADPDWWIKTLYRDLARFDEETLRQAFDAVRRDKPGRGWWPSPEEFEAAANGIAAEKAAGVTTDEEGRKIVGSKLDRMRKARDAFMRSAIGQEACRDGWARELVLWFENRAHGRTDTVRDPNDYEIGKMRRSQVRMQATMASLRRTCSL